MNESSCQPFLNAGIEETPDVFERDKLFLANRDERIFQFPEHLLKLTEQTAQQVVGDLTDCVHHWPDGGVPAVHERVPRLL
jgi:hypothetical protein